MLPSNGPLILIVSLTCEEEKDHHSHFTEQQIKSSRRQPEQVTRSTSIWLLNIPQERHIFQFLQVFSGCTSQKHRACTLSSIEHLWPRLYEHLFFFNYRPHMLSLPSPPTPLSTTLLRIFCFVSSCVCWGGGSFVSLWNISCQKGKKLTAIISVWVHFSCHKGKRKKRKKKNNKSRRKSHWQKGKRKRRKEVKEKGREGRIKEGAGRKGDRKTGLLTRTMLISLVPHPRGPEEPKRTVFIGKVCWNRRVFTL